MTGGRRWRSDRIQSWLFRETTPEGFERHWATNLLGPLLLTTQWLPVQDTYAVQVTPGEHDLLVLASVLALDLADDAERRDRQHPEPTNGTLDA
jgi:NAD(P)-dependent dehydrogenase (short-subunit alcohol dehydrogenase family)